MITAALEVVAEVAEKAVEIGIEAAEKTGEKAVEVGKRVESVAKSMEKSTSEIDVSKRVKGNGIQVDKLPKAIELTVEQKEALLSRNMSPNLIEKCTFQDGIYKLKTRNAALEGMKQPDSGVPYLRKVVDLFGIKVEGVFPRFDPIAQIQLPADKLTASNAVQFKECINQLQNTLKENPQVKENMLKSKLVTPEQMQLLENGILPQDLVWHHTEDVGRMELVDRKIHDLAKHDGGNAIWGGKYL